MVTIVGFLVVVGAVIGGFTWAGGHVGSLFHPSEILTIGGASLGALIVMSPMPVLKKLVAGLIGTLKGNPFGRSTYDELFKLMYQLFRKARRDGLLALEPHVADPHESAIFKRYPKIHGNHHATAFIAGALGPMLDGSVDGAQLEMLLDAEIHAMEAEHHAPVDVLSKTADGLPGFGIVAAVLGIVVTMGHIGGPVEEIGHSVGAALVGTFLGILASYGFIAPLVVKMDFAGHAESAFMRAIASSVTCFMNNMPPKIAIEAARRGLPQDVRPSSEELETMLKEVDSYTD
ncbi:MAG: flagellar motor stator protein MotA [Pirellulaceae bacterium]|nr:flagellar motor stator protein MotA [Pirellulaceae bacterium]